MGIAPDLILTFAEALDNYIDERIRACDYYSSKEYDQHVKTAVELLDKIRKHLGDKYTELFKEFSDLSDIHGQQLGALASSVYRRGFIDALILAREMEKAGKDLLPLK